jgi:ATP-dependent RNA helicase SUPV3L1/SUV3
MVARLWAAAGLPDFRKLGVDPHARFVGRLFGYLSEGQGHIPHSWFAEEIARLDNVAGDVETLAGRIAAARSWAYIAHRADWLADPSHWAARAAAVEERLSDALHLSLTQRFVDKRTTMLLRQIGADRGALPVVIGPEGEVMVEDHPIGRLDGFRFTVAADARHGDKRLLLAAAERRLGDERARRGEALAAAADTALAIDDDGDRPVIRWDGLPVAELGAGATLLRPRVALDRALDCLDRGLRAKIQARLEQWLAGQLRRRLPGLVALDMAQRDPAAPPSLRAVAAALVDAGGILPRAGVADATEALDPPARKGLRAMGVTIGTLDLFDARLLKPGPARWRRLLLGARGDLPAGVPPEGATVLPRDAPGAVLASGFRPFGAQAVRVDLVERIARAAHDARAGRKPFTPDPGLATSIGLAPATLARLMAALGFRTASVQDGAPRWVWRGLARPKAVPPPRDNAFAALAGLRRSHG